jgi:hypothetical protein
MVIKLLFLSLSAYMHRSIMMLPPTHKPHHDRHQPHAACLLQSVPNEFHLCWKAFTSCVVSWDDPPQSNKEWVPNCKQLLCSVCDCFQRGLPESFIVELILGARLFLGRCRSKVASGALVIIPML